MATVASSAPSPSASPAAGVLRLERFLESVLKENLDQVLVQRDALYATVAQCAQLRWLMEDMHAFSRHHSFITASTAAEAASSTTTATTAMSSSGGPLRSKRAEAELYTPPQRNKILVDLGNRFYTHGIIRDAGTVHMNLGCGVVLPMSLDDARAFLRRREAVVRHMILNKSKEALRITYRIRIVTEAIARLNEQHMGV
ncbi:Prefoldin subunit [Novymonas esmeraldas]|uniref:Prefoldin subunit n=1 Tax=Novymonas esmeraldas TaxID=1808958 RepID=A0AAW0EU79_9TRYP